jgi:hypothetical protein
LKININKISNYASAKLANYGLLQIFGSIGYVLRRIFTNYYRTHHSSRGQIVQRRNQRSQRRHRNRRGWEYTFVGGNSPCRNSHPKASAEDPVFPLSCARSGDRLRIVELPEGLSIPHLHVGAQLSVSHHTPRGSIIADINGDRLGFGCHQADSILVSREPHSESD